MPFQDNNNIRLHFLGEMISNSDLTKEQIAAKLGITIQSLNAILRVDDCRISTLHSIASALGYNIKIEYDIPEKNNFLIIRKGPGISEKKLQGLLDLMRQKDLNSADMGRILEITQTGFCYILKKDDTRFSNLYKIAEKLNTKLIVSITEKQQ